MVIIRYKFDKGEQSNEASYFVVYVFTGVIQPLGYIERR